LIVATMSFQDRLKRAREAQERAAQAQSEAIKDAEEEDAQRRSAVGETAKKMLPQVLEAVQALREDEARSRAALMARPNPSDRWYPGLGPMLGTVQTREKRRYLPGFAVYQGWGFIGWWIRSEPFEFEIPLDGSPVAGMMSNVSSSPKRSLESFAQQGIYVYHVGEGGPLKRREGTAVQGFSDLLTQVMGHLLTLR
jgi:hypothetical protein